MDLLNIQKGATYKRMNGETALTTAEMISLSQHFRVSMDTAFQNKPFISFRHPFVGANSGMELLDIFAYYLKPIVYTKTSSLTYLANEIPIFYYLSHPHIFNFLMAIWEHMHKSDQKLRIDPVSNIDEDLEILRNEVTAYYNSRPVTEIWNSNMLSNLYQQIIFSVSIRGFNNANVVELLIQDIEKLIFGLKELALNEKEHVNRPSIYLNEFGNYLNMVIYETDKFKATFMGMDIPQFMVSHDPEFYAFANDWVGQIKKRSVLISSGGYQSRELFFVKLDKDLAQFKDTTNKLMGVYYS